MPYKIRKIHNEDRNFIPPKVEKTHVHVFIYELVTQKLLVLIMPFLWLPPPFICHMDTRNHAWRFTISTSLLGTEFRCCNRPIQKYLLCGTAHEGTRNDKVEINCDLRIQPEPTLQNLFHIHSSKTHCFLEACSLALFSFYP